MAVHPLVAKWLLQSTTSKKGRKIISAVLAALIGLLLLFVVAAGAVLSAIYYFINPQLGGDLTQDPHYQAIQEIRAEYEIENELELSYLKVIELLDTHALTRDKQAAKQYILDYFIESFEETIVREPADETLPAEGETEPPEEVTVTRYRFLTNAQLMQTVILPPFSFDEEALDAIRNMVYAQAVEPSELIFNGPYPMPMSGSVTSAYGKRLDPFTGKEDFHTGIDIRGEWRDSVISIADGTVHDVGRDNIYGYYILIEHQEDGHPFFSFYAHLSQQLVAKGQKVKQGVVIGKEGGDPKKDIFPGRSTGHHLHFGIHATPERSSHLDPTAYLYSSTQGE